MHKLLNYVAVCTFVYEVIIQILEEQSGTVRSWLEMLKRT